MGLAKREAGRGNGNVDELGVSACEGIAAGWKSAALENIGKTMIARLHNNGVEVRVDLGNTGENWPNCQQSQKGFPWLNFGVAAWQHAEDFARENGATEIIKTGLRTE